MRRIGGIALLLLFSLFASVLAHDPDSDLTPLEKLGKNIFHDKISVPPEKQACVDCHTSSAGWAGPDSTQNLRVGIFEGAVPGRFADRAPQSAAYAAFSPLFHYDEELGFCGGNMWDGRVHGYHLGNTTSDQALFPILSPVEHGNQQIDVLTTIATSTYVGLWVQAFGAPVDLTTTTGPSQPFGGVPYADYYKVGLALGAYQKSKEVSRFSSKYDRYLCGKAKLTDMEKRGLKIFEGKGHCACCHSTECGPKGRPPLFTDNAFWNIGVPKNPALPRYARDPNFVDLGVGETLRALADPNTFSPFAKGWRDEPFVPESMRKMKNSQLRKLAEKYDGRFRTPTLRNITQAPYPGFVKAYMHNGAIKSLLGAIELHNSRALHLWDPPECERNMETERVGDLCLSLEELLCLIAFLDTLKDGYDQHGSITAQSEGDEPALPVTVPTEFAFGVAERNSGAARIVFLLDLPNAENVKLHLYDPSGRAVATLLNEVLPAGSHRIQYDRRHLPDGVYLAVLATPVTTQYRSVSLMR